MKISETHHRLRANLCPVCGTFLDSVTQVESGDEGAGLPEVGSVTVCIRCAAVLEFQADMSLRAVSLDSLEPEHRAFVEQVVNLIKEMHACWGNALDSGVSN